jgi:hypothetical protein
MKLLYIVLKYLVEIIQLPILVLAALLSRFVKKNVQIGLGPLPMINNVYHKKALIKYGYSAETFVDSLYFITHEFDYVFYSKNRFLNRLIHESNFIYYFALFRYQCIYIYFNGGTLHSSCYLWRLEPFLHKMAGLKTVVMPFGGDIQELTRTPNLLFRHVMAKDYPLQRFIRNKIATKIDIWSKYASHVIGGCDWVDYMHFWHTLMVAHFSIEVEKWQPTKNPNEIECLTNRPLRVLHAPNHRAIKGTDYFVKAIKELQDEGESIELILVQGLSNDKIKELVDSVDIVADQLIIGWYAMFAIEAMAMEKPVLCYLRHDLEHLYINAGLISESEIPIINCTPATIKSTLKHLLYNREKLNIIGKKGGDYVKKHHSIEAVGAVFAEINRSIGLV